MKSIGRIGVVLVVWVALVFAQSNTVDQLVANWPNAAITGTHWTVYDHAAPSTRWTDESDAAALSMYFAGSLFWSGDAGLNFPPPVPAPGDMLGIIGSFDPEYADNPSGYGDNAAHKGYYWLYSEALVSYTDNHWLTDTARALPKPSVAQSFRQDSVEVSIQNPAETRYTGQTSYDALGFDLWSDTTGTGTPNSFDLYLGFYPLVGNAGEYTLIQYWPGDFYATGGTYQTYHAYYLVAAPGFTTDEDDGHMTAYMSENSNLAEIVGIAEQKDAVPMHMSLNAAPSITRNRSVLSYALTKTTPVTITIYNASGQVVSTLVDGVQTAGEHSVMFDGTDAPSGVYFCQLKTPDAQLQTKLTVLR